MPFAPVGFVLLPDGSAYRCPSGSRRTTRPCGSANFPANSRPSPQGRKNGVEVKLQMNALSVLQAPTGNEDDDEIDGGNNSFCGSFNMGGKDMNYSSINFQKPTKPRVFLHDDVQQPGQPSLDFEAASGPSKQQGKGVSGQRYAFPAAALAMSMNTRKGTSAIPGARLDTRGSKLACRGCWSLRGAGRGFAEACLPLLLEPAWCWLWICWSCRWGAMIYTRSLLELQMGAVEAEEQMMLGGLCGCWWSDRQNCSGFKKTMYTS